MKSGHCFICSKNDFVAFLFFKTISSVFVILFEKYLAKIVSKFKTTYLDEIISSGDFSKKSNSI